MDLGSKNNTELPSSKPTAILHSADYLTQQLSLFFILVLTLQIFVVYTYFHNFPDMYNLIALFIAIQSATVFWLSFNWLLLARVWLSLTYLSYLVVTSYYLGNGSQLHYFIVISIVIIPFLFRKPMEKPIVVTLVLTYLLGFVVSMFIFDNGLYALNTEQLRVMQINNTVFLVFITGVIANLLRPDLTKRWYKNQDQIESHIRHYPNVAVIFLDVADFSQLSQRHGTVKTLCVINDYFCQLTLSLEQWRLIKVKSLGDGLLVCSQSSNHRHIAADQAYSFAQFALKQAQSFKVNNLEALEVKVGMAMGDIHAGFAPQSHDMDIWGNAVNLACRMQQHAKSGEIRTTESIGTYLQNTPINCRKEGIFVKGYGRMSTYLLSG